MPEQIGLELISDIFCLYYDAETKKVGGINGSGKAPQALTLDHLRQQGIKGDTVSASIYIEPAGMSAHRCTPRLTLGA